MQKKFLPSWAGASQLIVSGCQNATVNDIIRGQFILVGEHHGKPLFKKNAQVTFEENLLDVLIFFWDARDGEAFSGWWFGPNLGGEEIWGFNADTTSMLPPVGNWRVPHRAPVDPTLQIVYSSHGRSYIQRMCSAKEHELAAITIQRRWRGSLARLSVTRFYSKIYVRTLRRTCSRLVQIKLRLMRKIRKKYLVTLIQKVWRGVLVRRRVLDLISKMYARSLRFRVLPQLKKNGLAVYDRQSWCALKSRIRLRNRRVAEVKALLASDAGSRLPRDRRTRLTRKLRRRQMCRGQWVRACLLIQAWWRSNRARRKIIPETLAADVMQASHAGGTRSSQPGYRQVLSARLACAKQFVLNSGIGPRAMASLETLSACRIWRTWCIYKMKMLLSRMRRLGMSSRELSEFVGHCLDSSKKGNECPTMGGLPVEIEDQFLCAICYGMLFRPVTTPCKHTFCKYCLVLWLETQGHRNRQLDVEFDQRECPLCRSEIGIMSCMSDVVVNEELEDEIVQTYGMEMYNSRHKDIVAEKVDRLVKRHSESGRLARTMNESEDTMSLEVYFTSQFLLMGGALTGPVGLAIVSASLAGFLVGRGVYNSRQEDKANHALMEDEQDAPLDNLIRLVNLSMISVKAYLYRNGENGWVKQRCLETALIEPGRTFCFTGVEPVAEDQVKYHVKVARSLMLVEGELAEKIVLPGKSYLFLRLDSVVQQVGSLVEGHSSGEQLQRAALQVHCAGSRSCKLFLYGREDALCWFPKHEVTLEVGASETINPVHLDTCFKVVIMVYKHDGRFPWDNQELLTVEMQRGKCYSVHVPDGAQTPSTQQHAQQTSQQQLPIPPQPTPFTNPEFEDDSDESDAGEAAEEEIAEQPINI